MSSAVYLETENNEKNDPPRRDRVDDLLVEGPDLVPLHHDHRATATLSNDELLQALDGHSATHHSTNGWEAGVVPENIFG